MRSLIVAVSSIAILGACTTTLKTEHVSASTEPKPGVLYNLPMATFDVEAKFLITSCTVGANDVAQIGYQLTDGVIQHNLAPDSLETYRLDYASLNSALKTTTVSITLHPNGMIKAVNADVDDRTAQVVTSLAGTLVSLYKASTLSFVPTAARGAKKCDDFLLTKLEARRLLIEHDIPNAKGDDKALSNDMQAADDINVELEDVKLKLAEAQKVKDNVAIGVATANITALQNKLAIAMSKLKDRAFKVPVLQAKLVVLTESLTATAKLSNWAPRPPGPEVCETFAIEQRSFIARLAEASNAKVEIPPAPTSKFSADACVAVSPNPRLATPAVGGYLVHRHPEISL